MTVFGAVMHFTLERLLLTAEKDEFLLSDAIVNTFLQRNTLVKFFCTKSI